MSLSDRITRLPRAFDPDLGAETRLAVPTLTGDMAALIEGAAGCSPYLKGLIDGEAHWLTEAVEDPEAAVHGVFEIVRELAPDQLKDGLRQAKRRIALLVALADLAGAWPLAQVTGVLTEFADLACSVALQAEIARLIRRDKLPGQTEADIAEAGGMVVLAMGKMGAGELNYSSDIDLICLFDETRFDPVDYMDARQGFVKATRAMSAILNDRTAEGYVFRTDLRLRPDPAVTPVCLAMEAAERYYESLGRTWERAAYIKARPAAGDLQAGARFLDTLQPFVWRRHLDFAAIQDAHDMRLRIRETKGLSGPITVPGHDLKLGRGGIREIEFFTQTRQLIAGGRDPGLRLRGTVEGLAALADRNWVPDDVAARLTDHYRILRETEHRVQMVHDAQTHKLPQSPAGMERLACLMGTEPGALQADLKERLTEVHSLTEDFFAPDAAPPPETVEATVEIDDALMARWSSYPAFRTQRAIRIFERLRPEILTRLGKAARPDEALRALDGFLAGLPAGVQLFSLFDANPHLIDLLIDVVGTSPALAGYLSRNSGVFDAVIGGDFFADWPGEQGLRAALARVLEAEEDYELQLDAARRWTKEWHFRIGVHFLRGLIDAQTAGLQYAELAGAVISALFPVVTAEFARKHGSPPGRGAAILGMGSLGARRLNAGSDLDIIVIYDPLEDEYSDGRRPLAARLYYARLTQAVITAMTAPMAQGRLYDVDMRLRPSGSQGPVATSWASFQSYQTDEAWTWEHLALTRARVIVGPEDLGRDIEAFRTSLLGAPHDQADVLTEVSEMRRRIAAAKSPNGVWDAKTGAGRLQDIELIAQAGALISGSTARDVQSGLADAAATGWLMAKDADRLQQFYALLWSVVTATRILSEAVIDSDAVGEGGADFLCHSTGFGRISDLQAALETGYAQAMAIIDAAVEQGKKDEG